MACRKHLSLFAIVLGVIVLAMCLFGDSCSGQVSGENPFLTGPVYPASSATQFKVNVAYAYYGDIPGNDTASVVFLNFTRLPGVQITDCNAVVELYGVKIAPALGSPEYYAYFVGTNYTDAPAFSREAGSVSNVNGLADFNLYRSFGGSFNYNWTEGTSVIGQHVGSIAFYSGSTPPTGALGVWSDGKPKSVTVTVYRIGYETITDNSFTLYNETSEPAVATASLSAYGNGFLFNQMVPTSQLPQTNLFYPPTDLSSQASSVPEFSSTASILVIATVTIVTVCAVILERKKVHAKVVATPSSCCVLF